MKDLFTDDTAWVKFKCLELAKDVSGKRGAKIVVETALEFEKFILPKATILKLQGTKNEKKNNHK